MLPTTKLAGARVSVHGQVRIISERKTLEFLRIFVDLRILFPGCLSFPRGFCNQYRCRISDCSLYHTGWKSCPHWMIRSTFLFSLDPNSNSDSNRKSEEAVWIVLGPRAGIDRLLPELQLQHGDMLSRVQAKVLSTDDIEKRRFSLLITPVTVQFIHSFQEHCETVRLRSSSIQQFSRSDTLHCNRLWVI